MTTSALTDVLARLEAMETQLARLTAATEVNENALTTIDMRLNALEGGGAAPSGSLCVINACTYAGILSDRHNSRS